MTKRLYVGLLLAALGTSGVRGAEESIVRAIVITNLGPGHLDESYVTTHSAIRAGDALDRQRVSTDLRRLLDAWQHTNSIYLISHSVSRSQSR